MAKPQAIDTDDAFGHWFAGFVDGEGCFDIHPVGEHYICRFGIGLRADDADVLQQIKNWTGVGTLSYIAQKPGSNAQAQARWNVERKHEVHALLPIFDRYPLRAKKARDYATWRQAVLVWIALRKGSRWHGRSPATAHLAALRGALIEGRRFDAGQELLPPSDDQLRLIA